MQGPYGFVQLAVTGPETLRHAVGTQAPQAVDIAADPHGAVAVAQQAGQQAARERRQPGIVDDTAMLDPGQAAAGGYPQNIALW